MGQADRPAHYLSEESLRSHLKALFERAHVADLAQGAKRFHLAEIALATGIVGHDIQ